LACPRPMVVEEWNTHAPLRKQVAEGRGRRRHELVVLGEFIGARALRRVGPGLQVARLSFVCLGEKGACVGAHTREAHPWGRYQPYTHVVLYIHERPGANYHHHSTHRLAS